MVLEAVLVEITEHQKVLIESWVNDEYIEGRWDYVAFCAHWGIQLQHEHGTTNVDQNYCNDQANVPDVWYSPLNQGHIERGIVEKPEPVEHGFDSLTNDDKNA